MINIEEQISEITRKTNHEFNQQIEKVIETVLGISAAELKEMSTTDIKVQQLDQRVVLKDQMGIQKTTVCIDGEDVAEVSVSYFEDRITISTHWLFKDRLKELEEKLND